jgi:hypothetical protein
VIDTLVQNQRHNVSVIVFTDKSVEDSFENLLSENINEINNRLMTDTTAITNVSFVNIRDEREHNYKDIFKLDVFPQILVFEKKEIVLQTNDPKKLFAFYEDKYKTQ